MANDEKHWWQYVLKLEQGKWYVGITSQTPEKRFQEHLHGRKTYWTEKYPPIEIADQKYLGDLNKEEAEAYEKKVTLTYMKEKGVNSVRGGSLTQTDNLVMRFGRIFDEFAWEGITVAALLILVIIALVLDKYL